MINCANNLFYRKHKIIILYFILFYKKHKKIILFYRKHKKINL